MRRKSSPIRLSVPWLGVLLLALLTQSLRAAQNVVVTLADGREVRGELVQETSEKITLRIAGITTSFERQQVKSMERLLTISEQYEQKKAELDPKDVEGRYNLTKWLFDKEEYRLALDELAELQKLAPNDERFELLKKVTTARLKMKLEAQAAAAQAPAVPSPKPPVKETPATDPAKPTKPGPVVSTPDKDFEVPAVYLSDEQISALKVYELNLSNRPRVRFKREDLETFLDRYNGEPEMPSSREQRQSFLRAEGWQQLMLMFRVKAREFYAKAEVVGDPDVFREFQSIHDRYVVNRCATADCHGSNVGGFFLYGRNAKHARNNDRLYTNFALLNQYQTAEAAMIDRQQTDRSLLYQYLLARDIARTPHPEVRGWQPAFRETTDKGALEVLNWIGMLYRPAPEYGFYFTIPGVTPATPAAAAPAAPAPAAPQPAPTPAAPQPKLGGFQ